ncbi:MAG: AMP-binding protein [Vicinamibacterales bacterium]|nr:AMP-binding protein [Vicinamibacterales bacterium]
MSNYWELFAAAAARAGERTAIEVQRAAGLEQVSYTELKRRAEAIAAWLAGQGIAPGDRCAILADNDAAWCAAYLGIFRLGAVAVPLDTNYSAAQVATITADAGARVLFAGTRLWDTAQAAVATLDHVRLVAIAGPFDAGATDVPPCPSTWADPAVILYTSGTTADPKGVVLSHGNLEAERTATFQVVDVHEGDSVLGVLPLFHALAQMGNLLLPFALGARVVFLETLNTTELLRALREREVSLLICVPQFFYLIHERVRGEVAKAGVVAGALFSTLLSLNRMARKVGVNLGPAFFRRVHAVMGPRMRLLVTGGSKFDPAIGGDLYALGFTILQAYGLTETSGAATINRPDEAHLDTVGRALPGVEMRILPPDAPDANGGGEALDGEIALRGPIVMQGYFNRPDATAEVMRDGWFRTGDLGRLDAEGRLTITGRRKEVIILASGKNLHPEEIEAHYRRSRYIKEVCVLGLTGGDAHHSERLHAVIVPDPDALRERKVVTIGELLRFEIEGLTAELPSTKRILGYDLWTEPLPRTTTGKLKRHEIARRLAEHQAARQAEVERPLDDEERVWLEDPRHAAMVGAITARARGGARIVPGASLDLDLGLDSMERVELITELERRFGVRFDTERAHEVLTVRDLVEALAAQAGPGEAARVEQPWAAILGDLPPATDPDLGSLLAPRPLFAPFAWLVVRTLRLILPRIEATGLEHLPARGPFILAPTHSSYLDPFVLACVLPHRIIKDLFFVGATEYFSSPVMRRVARAINLVPVDPDANLVPAMKAGAFGLAHGRILMIFPEGERSIDGTVRRFKKGSPILAQHLGVPIVPVALNGIYELWPRNQVLRRRLLAPWNGHRLKVTLGAPMAFSPEESAADATARLRETVAAMWDRQQAGMGSGDGAGMGSGHDS